MHRSAWTLTCSLRKAHHFHAGTFYILLAEGTVGWRHSWLSEMTSAWVLTVTVVNSGERQSVAGLVYWKELTGQPAMCFHLRRETYLSGCSPHHSCRLALHICYKALVLHLVTHQALRALWCFCCHPWHLLLVHLMSFTPRPALKPCGHSHHKWGQGGAA